MKRIAWVAAAAILWVGTPTNAQWDPEAGDTGEWQPPQQQQQQQPPPDQRQPPPQQQQQQQPPPQQQQQWPQQQQQQQQPPQQQQQQWPQQQQQPAQQQQQQQPGWFQQDQEQPPGVSGEQPSQGGSSTGGDHAEVVGSLGITFFGVDEMLAGAPQGNAIGFSIPKLGIRYWLASSVGLDIGLGVGIRNNSVINPCFRTDGDFCIDSERTGGVNGGFALAFQVGLPIALSTGAHHSLLFIPELGIGYSTATLYSGDSGVSEADISMSGLQIDAGVRLGAEVHFGGIGLPNLALQISIGLGIRYYSGSSENGEAREVARGRAEFTQFELLSIHNNALNGTIRLTYYL